MSVSSAEFAWPGGDRPPDRPEFKYEVPEAVAAAIGRALAPWFPSAAQPGARLSGLRASEGPAGRYRLTTSDGDAWFVRVSARWGAPELERSIAAHLAERGVPVNPLLVAGRTLEWNGASLRIDVRPFVTGRHFDGSVADLSRLAASVAACHRALDGWSGASAVLDAARDRYQRLAKARDLVRDAARRGDFALFAEHATWAGEHGAWLREMGEAFEPRFDEAPGAQCLHGQVHTANVLFRTEDATAVLVDFEESVQVFAPPAWDLAFLVQRFCLGDEPSPALRTTRLAAVAAAYGAPLPPLASMMRQAAWFSIAAIVDARTHGVVTPRDEYDKFVRLEAQGRALEGAL